MLKNQQATSYVSFLIMIILYNQKIALVPGA